MEEMHRSFFIPTDKMKIVSIRHKHRSKRSFAITLIAVLQCLGWMVFSGIKVSHHLNRGLPDIIRENAVLTNAYNAIATEFTQIGFIWFTITTILSFLGLFNMKSWGWACAIVANALWISSVALSFDQNIYMNTIFEKFFFIFFALFALLSSLYLWIKRFSFWR